ncbi:MAG: hypothetical protein HY064_12135 [Bacteroidetes bacterium]|nr:hypothetical protein [Bacteroidota bacterium]
MHYAALIFLLPSLLSFIFGRLFAIPGSDKYYHKLLIALIRTNKYYPITTHTCFVNTTKQSYPQLVHWLLSFSNDKTFEWFNRNMPFAINFFLGMSCIFILHLFPGMLGITLTENQILFSALIYALVPYVFNPGNAKNVGLSARGVGVLFGLWYTFALLAVHHDHENQIMMGIAAASAFFILFSSQFATQYLVLGTILICILLRDPLIALFPFAGFFIYLVFFPRIALRSIAGQWSHKKLYFTQLADRFILKTRYSIWRDLVYDIPKILLTDIRKGYNPLRVLFSAFRKPYIAGNPMLIVVTEMLLVPLACVAYWYGRAIPGVALISVPVWTTLSLFFLTSFRKTRFLGEPERYVEFAFLFAAVVDAMVFPLIVIGILLFLSFIRIIFMVTRYGAVAEHPDTAYESAILEVHEFLVGECKNFIPRIICNSTNACKYLFDERIHQYYYLVNAVKNDEFSFSEIYSENYSYVSENMLPVLVERYRLNFLVIDTALMKKNIDQLFPPGISPKQVFRKDRFIVYSMPGNQNHNNDPK